MASINDPRSGNKPPAQDDILYRLSELDNSLLEGLDSDERLQSGVPDAHRASDLEFIQMTGLTRPLPEAEPAGIRGPAPPETEARHRATLSFFEKGVADVDAAMAPPSLEEPGLLDEDILPEAQERPVAERVEEPVSPEASFPEIVEDVAEERQMWVDVSRDQTPEIVSEPEAVETFPEATGDGGVALEAFEPEPSAPSPHPDLADLAVLLDDRASEPEVSEAPASGATRGMPEAAGALTARGWSTGVPEIEAEPDESPSGLEPLRTPELAEAEQLLQALESQPRERTPDGERAAEMAIPPEAAPTDVEPDLQEALEKDADEVADRDESVYSRPLAKHRRRSRRNRGRRHAIRWTVRIGVVMVVVAGALGVYSWTRPLLATPEDLWRQARALETAERYADASDAYLRFAAIYPEQPDRPEAQFRAASCLRLASASSFDAVQRVRAHALELFQQFVNDNPAHEKVARAKTQMGLLQFELGEFQAAIALLQDPSLLLNDPAAALPALRTLARARWKLGDYDNATSAYLQAAALSTNYTADQDYEELGDLFRWRADHTRNAEENREFQQAAVEYWDKALRMPTLDPSSKSKIQEKRKWLLQQLEASAAEDRRSPGDRGDGKAPPEQEGPAESKAEPQETPSSGVPDTTGVASNEQPAAPDPSNASAAVDPRQEARYPGTKDHVADRLQSRDDRTSAGSSDAPAANTDEPVGEK
jgi:tetratricopeptide (TPR) repeat protein